MERAHSVMHLWRTIQADLDIPYPSVSQLLARFFVESVRCGAGAEAHPRGAGGLVGQTGRQGWRDASAGHQAPRNRPTQVGPGHARKMRWLTYDPSADLESPEQKAITATAADDIWTPEQMSTLDHVAPHRLGGCFGLTLLGLRREEVGGLRWSDVALEAGTLRIRQARVYVNGRDTIVATKTERSARDLPLPPRELAMLKAMSTAHLRERLAVGRPLADDELLLSRVDGTWLPVHEYSREFSAQRKTAGLKAITLGKLRHSNISRMRAAGIAADVVAAWHGHTERMTQAVYGRVTDDRLTAASAVFSASAVGQLGVRPINIRK